MPEAAVVESHFIQVRDAAEAMKIATEHGFAGVMQPGYSWEWRELKVPTGPLGFGWYVESILPGEKVKVSRATEILPQEQAIMRLETSGFDGTSHDGLAIATREDGCVFGFRPGSVPAADMKFRRLAILHPTRETPAFMDWAGKAFGSATTEDAYVYHVRTPQE